jgi:hypothetical protein
MRGRIAFDNEPLTMVRNGSKRMTRRVVRGDPPGVPAARDCPLGRPGQRLRGLESYRITENSWCLFQDGILEVAYEIGGKRRLRLGYQDARRLVECAGPTWRPPQMMPDWASRYRVKLRSVRAEKLADITDRDAQAEGFSCASAFSQDWDRRHRLTGPPADRNPLVWVLGFTYEPLAVVEEIARADSEVQR